MLIGLLMIIEIIKLEEHPDNSTYTKNPDRSISISDPEIFIPIIIASIVLIVILIIIIICFRKRCPSCLPCLLC